MSECAYINRTLNMPWVLNMRKILNMAKFGIWQGSQYASVARIWQDSEYLNNI